MKKFFLFFKKSLKSFFFPKKCLICNKKGCYLCPDCYSLIPLENFLVVQSGSQLNFKYLDKIYWTTNYQNFIVKKLIQSYKYPPFLKNLSSVLGQLLYDFILLNELRLNSFDYLLPLPSTPLRKRWRGFDHILEICIFFSEKIKIPILKDNLVKTRNTPPQTELSFEQRKINPINTFLCLNPSKIENKKIILIDDVLTTGTTLNEAARVLKSAGCQEVLGMVIARD